jgi:hypothetical protein
VIKERIFDKDKRGEGIRNTHDNHPTKKKGSYYGISIGNYK